MNKFSIWLEERDNTIQDVHTTTLKNFLGLSPLKDSSFMQIQLSDFEKMQEIHTKITHWNFFTDKLSEVSKNKIYELLKNENTRMIDLIENMEVN